MVMMVLYGKRDTVIKNRRLGSMGQDEGGKI